MHNAHRRMAKLHFEFSTSKRSTFLSLTLDRMILERDPDAKTPGRLHLLSIVGSDAEISAINAALSNDVSFRIETVDEEFSVFMAAKPDCFRASLNVKGRSRPLRHLLALSNEMTDAATASNPEKVYLFDSSPEFVWISLAYIYGLPGHPDWASWMYQRLREERALVPLLGIGCDPVAVLGGRDLFLGWLGEGRRRGELSFPESNGPIVWPPIQLKEVLMPIANISSEPVPQS